MIIGHIKSDLIGEEKTEAHIMYALFTNKWLHIDSSVGWLVGYMDPLYAILSGSKTYNCKPG